MKVAGKNRLSSTRTFTLTVDAASLSVALREKHEAKGDSTTDPYSEWAAGVFTPDQLADATISGDDADPDHDGLVNLLECLLGGQPLADDRDLLPTLSTTLIASGRKLVFSYRRKLAAAGITQVIESTSDFASPWTVVAYGEESVALVDAETEQVTVTIPTSGAKAFVRLRASR